MASTKEIIINPEASPLNKKAIDIETKLLVAGIIKADKVESISKIAEVNNPILLVFNNFFMGLYKRIITVSTMVLRKLLKE